MIWVLVAGIFALRFVLALLLPLSPQEAYYWNYSRHLALSYFDHPPLAAWSIACFTFLFGDNVFAIRFPAFLYSVGTFFVLYSYIRSLVEASVKELLPLLLSPFFFVGGMQMLPDSPLLFFYSLGLCFGHRAAVKGNPRDWYGFGAATGLVLLSKYSGVLILAGLGGYVVLARNWKLLRSRHFWLSLMLCGIIFSPVVIWNAQNHWVSFLFQSTRRAGELSGFNPYNFGRYLFSQMLIVSPILWLVNWQALRVGLRSGLKERDNSILFLASLAVPFFVVFTVVSFFYWVKLNWLWPGYLVGTVLAIALAAREKIAFRFKANVIGAAAITCASCFLLFYQPLAVSWAGNNVVGWRELAEKVEQIAKARGGEWLVAAYGHKTASQLAFYLSSKPESYSSSLIGERGLQYDLWFDERRVWGKNFIFVVDRRHQLRDAVGVLSNFFSRIEPSESLAVKSGRGDVTTFYVYLCYGYKGR